ncbi:MAG: AAA family ATPase [Muribaculaceae bacterium]|nr:AAA family ATPase [Muribaculaceae bacterium]
MQPESQHPHLLTGSDLAGLAIAALPFVPLEGQTIALYKMAEYVVSGLWRDVFVLNGYAGTGKTSVVAALIKALAHLKIKTVVLAPTGRAAKVAGAMAGRMASTIHRRIYHLETTQAGESTVSLSANRDQNTVFIVDEASLITDSARSSLLRDLTRYVYSGQGCRMILVGDTAQLPPVGQPDSPAMNLERLKQIGLAPFSHTLDVPVRQSAESGVLYNATLVRKILNRILDGEPSGIVPGQLPLKLEGFPDICAVSSADLADELSTSWSTVGVEETLIITRSNARANRFNQAIRSIVMYAEEPLQQGDRLVIAKNDYFWGPQNKLKTFLANGETVIVKWVGTPEKAFGRWFVDTELALADGSEIAAKVMLRSLMAEGPAIPRQEMQNFLQLVINGSEGAGPTEKIMAAMMNPYYNAVQAKYAYCVTCHKAQGGQWKHVYVDMGGIPDDAMGTDFYRWLYTAITRATEKVFILGVRQNG